MKKIYKIIVSISVFMFVLFLGVVLVIGNTNKKANAGVIVETNYTITNITQVDETNHDNLYINCKYGSSNFEIVNCQISALYNNTSTLTGRARVQPLENWNSQIPGTYRVYVFVGSPGRQVSTSLVHITSDLKILLDMDYTYQHIQSNITNVVFNVVSSYSTQEYNFFYQGRNVISSVNNIYDLDNKSFCLLYLSDISGIATEQMRDEITINWGFINENDNELYAEYSPTISAQNLAEDNDTVIRIGVPLNNNGSAMNYYDISQKALLSTIDSSQGGAIATAHIYGIYVWRNQNMIEWGLAEFDTTSTPTSGASMNYLTNTTRLYQYQNMDTSTMTCRLNVSSNFNFITIKNQEQVDVSSVNAVIRQGGFMPAWALYNWARGSHSGFTSGEQYGAAPYQQGQPGYDAIFQAGRQAGLNENLGTQTWFMKIFQGVDAFLNIRIFPNITFGVLLGIPFVISVVWFIIRSFRGGGGS